MRLGEVVGCLVPVEADGPGRLERLLLEFEDQWPEAGVAVEGLLRRAVQGAGASGWLVYAHNPYPPEEGEPAREHQVPCGLVLASGAEQPGGACGLFVWMRGAYRNSGLGRPALREAFARLPERREALGLPGRLQVCLPTADLRGAGGALQVRMWLTFYYDLGFVRVDDGTGDAVLERAFPGA